MIFRDCSTWFIDNFMKMPKLNRKYPSGSAKRRKMYHVQKLKFCKNEVVE